MSGDDATTRDAGVSANYTEDTERTEDTEIAHYMACRDPPPLKLRRTWISGRRALPIRLMLPIWLMVRGGGAMTRNHKEARKRGAL